MWLLCQPGHTSMLVFYGPCVCVCSHHILSPDTEHLGSIKGAARPALAMLCRKSHPCVVLGPACLGCPQGHWPYQQRSPPVAHSCCCRAGIAAPEEVGKHSLGCLALCGFVLAQPGCCCGSGKQEGLGGEVMSCRVSGLCEPSPSWIAYEISLCSLRFVF